MPPPQGGGSRRSGRGGRGGTTIKEGGRGRGGGRGGGNTGRGSAAPRAQQQGQAATQGKHTNSPSLPTPTPATATATPSWRPTTSQPAAAAAAPAAAASTASTPSASTTVDLSEQQTKLRGWLEDSTIDSEQLATNALDECTTKPICQLFLQEVFTMALKANIDEEQISCNLERASTVIKDLHGVKILHQEKGKGGIEVYTVKDDLPEMIKERWIKGQTRVLVKFCSILVGKVPTLDWMSNNIFGVIKGLVDVEEKVKGWNAEDANFAHYVISNAMLALVTTRPEMEDIFKTFYNVIVEGSGIEETRACCLSLLQKREVLKPK